MANNHENSIDWFGEKTRQIEGADNLRAFGIRIASRYGNVDEIIMMIRFAELATVKGFNNYVKEISYGSKACVCSFEFSPDVVEGDAVETGLRECAKKAFTRGQCMWIDGDYVSFDDL